MADPSIFILGPGIGSQVYGGRERLVHAVLRYSGDIVNMVSVHRYAVMTADKCVTQVVSNTLRHEPTVLQALKDKVYQSSDVEIPLVVTGGLFVRAYDLKGKGRHGT